MREAVFTVREAVFIVWSFIAMLVLYFRPKPKAYRCAQSTIVWAVTGVAVLWMFIVTVMTLGVLVEALRPIIG